MDYFSDQYNYISSDTEGGFGNRLKDDVGGSFSPENPYARQIEEWERNGTNKGKVPSTLYESAWEWEERYTNAKINFGLNDPLITLNRNKAAGLNTDLSGGSGSTSTSSGSAGSGMQGASDNTSQDELNIQRDANKLNAFSASANALSSLASSFNQVASGISSIRQTRSLVNLQSAQANAQNAQADAIDAQAEYTDALTGELQTLLSGKKEFQDITNADAMLQSLIGMYDRGLVNQDTDLAPIVKSFGVSDDKVNGLTDVFKQLLDSPRAKGDFSRDVVYERESSAMEDVWSSEYVVKITEKAAQLGELQLDGEIMRQSISNNINKLLSQSNYAQTSADNLISGNNLQQSTIEYAKMQLEGDISAYTSYLFNMATERDELVKLIDEYDKRIDSKDRKQRLNAREKIEYEYARDAIRMIDSFGSSDCAQFNKLMGEINRNAYLSGLPNSLTGEDGAIQNVSLYWGQFVSGAYTKTDIGQMLLSPLMTGLGLAVNGYLAGKAPRRTGQTVTTYKPHNGGWSPNQRTVTQYDF